MNPCLLELALYIKTLLIYNMLKKGKQINTIIMINMKKKNPHKRNEQALLELMVK